MKTLLLLLTLAGATIFSSQHAQSQCSGPINNSNRSQGQGGTFSNASHWSMNTAPSPVNQVVVRNGNPMTLTSDYTLTGTNCLVIEPNSTLTINNGRIFAVGGSYHIINHGTIEGNGLLEIGPGCTLTNNGTVTTSVKNSGMIDGTGSISIGSGKYFTNNGSSISNTIINNGTLTIESSTTNHGPVTNNASFEIKGWATFTNAGIISGPGAISVSGSGNALINQGIISGAGDITIGTSCNFINEATGAVLGGTGGTMVISGAGARMSNLGTVSGTRNIELGNSSVMNNTGTVSIAGTVKLNSSAALNNYGSLSASGSWNVANGSSLLTTGTIHSGSVTIAGSIITIDQGQFNAQGEFALNSGPGQLYINPNGALNAASFRVNSGSFTNGGIISTTGNFTNNSSSTVYNNNTIMVQGNFVNTSNFMNNGPVTSGQGILIAGDYTNSGNFQGTGGYTEVAGFSRNSNGGIMQGDQRFCDLGNPPGGIDLNAGTITLTVKGCSGINPLPVTLVSLAGKLKEGLPVLEWVTSSEKNSDKFIIEKAGASMEFTEVGSVKSAGNSNTLQHYSFTDQTGLNGTTYYRLRQVDFDGSFQYSKIISLNGKQLPAMEIYPNPASASFTIKAPKELVNATVELVNMTGAVVFRSEIRTAATSEATDIRFDSNKPVPGLYMVRIISDGKAVLTPKSIIIN